ncbi:hypothetical protein [Leptolyngbya ohadii]|uniref:hypothetical protein n=1 Tax=Leptolyngbya ohadii TaxID=1962290 RepID=UPI001CEC1176|nr:hypothetical protein [Leptolyngbya ohadii]
MFIFRDTDYDRPSIAHLIGGGLLSFPYRTAMRLLIGFRLQSSYIVWVRHSVNR